MEVYYEKKADVNLLKYHYGNGTYRLFRLIIEQRS